MGVKIYTKLFETNKVDYHLTLNDFLGKKIYVVLLVF
jgi:hypothetical protein